MIRLIALLLTILTGFLLLFVQPEHQVRVEISSSNFPRFARNLNTGHPFGISNEIAVATQTIYHSTDYPSHITLPVIPSVRLIADATTQSISRHTLYHVYLDFLLRPPNPHSVGTYAAPLPASNTRMEITREGLYK